MKEEEHNSREEETKKEAGEERALLGQYLNFVLNDEVFGMNIMHIKEILERREIVEVPLASSIFAGVINLRGSVVPVVDLSVRLGGEPIRAGGNNCIIIAETEDEEGMMDIGMLVQEVREVRDVQSADSFEAPRFGANLRPDFLEGLGRIGENFVLLLDRLAVLNIDELTLLARRAEPGFDLGVREEET